MDWHHPGYTPRRPWEKDWPTEGADCQRYVDYMQGQIRELMTRYGRVDILWFDGGWERKDPADLAAFQDMYGRATATGLTTTPSSAGAPTVWSPRRTGHGAKWPRPKAAYPRASALLAIVEGSCSMDNPYNRKQHTRSLTARESPDFKELHRQVQSTSGADGNECP